VRGLFGDLPPTDWAYATFEAQNLGDGIAPNPPTDLQAAGWLGFAVLTWMNPDSIDLSHIEIWQAFEDDRSKAVQIGTTPQVGSTPPSQGTHTHLLPAGGVVWYWVRAVNYTGQKSAFNAEAGTPCIIDPGSFDDLIDELLKRPEVQKAIEELTTPIAEIRDMGEILAETVINNTMRDYEDFWHQKLADRAAEKQAEADINGAIGDYDGYQHTLAVVADESNKRETAEETLAWKIEGVAVMIGDPDNPGPDTVYGAIKGEMEIRATSDEVAGERINGVVAVIGDPSNPTPDSVYGAILREERARVTKDEAQAQRVETVAAILGDPSNPQPGTAFAVLNEEIKARATADLAELNARETLQARLYDAQNGDLKKISASIEHERDLRVDAVSAVASDVHTVQTQLGDNIASVQTLSKSVNGIESLWTTKLDVNGYISGLTMINLGEQKSSAVFLTDTFMIGKPGVNGGARRWRSKSERSTGSIK
jgi:predicted phage tail protein